MTTRKTTKPHLLPRGAHFPSIFPRKALILCWNRAAFRAIVLKICHWFHHGRNLCDFCQFGRTRRQGYRDEKQ